VKCVGEGNKEAAVIDGAALAHWTSEGAEIVVAGEVADEVHLVGLRARACVEHEGNVPGMTPVAVSEIDEVCLPRYFKLIGADGIFPEPGVDVYCLVPSGFD
jgi:hypothetical protein